MCEYLKKYVEIETERGWERKLKKGKERRGNRKDRKKGIQEEI